MVQAGQNIRDEIHAAVFFTHSATSHFLGQPIKDGSLNKGHRICVCNLIDGVGLGSDIPRYARCEGPTKCIGPLVLLGYDIYGRVIKFKENKYMRHFLENYTISLQRLCLSQFLSTVAHAMET